MRTFIENYLHFMKNCMKPHYEKLKPLKSGFIKYSNFENNRDPCTKVKFCAQGCYRLSQEGWHGAADPGWEWLPAEQVGGKGWRPAITGLLPGDSACSRVRDKYYEYLY